MSYGEPRPKMEIGSLGDLVQDPQNARKHTERNIGMIADSLQKYGAGRSILVDENNVILAGNGVSDAAAQVGIEKVLFVDIDGETLLAGRIRGLTPEQKVGVALYDNRTAELAEWDVGVLRRVQEANPDLLQGMFYPVELDTLFSLPQDDGDNDPARKDGGGDDFDGTPQEGQVRCKVGDVWRIGPHRMAVGDATYEDVVQNLMVDDQGEEVLAGAVVTDPPYGIEREGILNDSPHTLRVLFNDVLSNLPCSDAVVIAFQSPRLFPVWLDSLREQGQKFERALWFYDETDVTFPWRGWLMTSQIALVSSIGSPQWQDHGPYHHDTYMVKTAGQQDDSGGHTTAKPLDVVLDLVAHTTGIVYDPFVGSGTTLIAAHRLGRVCYCVELNPQYADVVLRRAEAEGITPIERIDEK